MKIEFDSSDVEPLVRQIVRDCVEELRQQLFSLHVRPNPLHSNHADALLLNSGDAAKLLGISERTLWELKRNGDLPYVVVGTGDKKKSIRYARVDLERLIESRKSQACENDTIAAKPPDQNT